MRGTIQVSMFNVGLTTKRGFLWSLYLGQYKDCEYVTFYTNILYMNYYVEADALYIQRKRYGRNSKIIHNFLEKAWKYFIPKVVDN